MLMNYGIVSNGTRDEGYATAVRAAEVILSSGNTPVFEKELEGKFDAPEGSVFATAEDYFRSSYRCGITFITCAV